MFKHLRYLAAISFLIVAIGAAFIVMVANEFKETSLRDNSNQQTQATLASYASSVWSRYAPFITADANSPYMASFTAETEQFFKGQPFSKITIFSFSGPTARLYYGNSQEYVTTDGSTRVTLFDIDKANRGTAVHQILKEVYLTGSRDATTPRTMLHSIIPITRAGGTAPDALAEIYIDMSHSWDAISQKLLIFIGVLVGVFTLLIVVLLVTASHAEGVITKQHEVNLELIAAAAQAEAQSRDKSQFLASVSHELRTPLNAIIGFSEIVRNETKATLAKVYQDYIDDIHASGKHLLSLINDILDFSKAEAGKLQIEWAETDAAKVIRNSLRMVLPRAETAQVTLVEDIPNHHLVIVIDAKKLKQVLLNLLSNSVKFTPAGGEVRCHAWSDVVTGALHIQVRDTGIGIAPKDISRVMTPFGQVDSALSRKYEGTGLGLPLSKKYVESMGGQFTIESEPNVGTNVTIIFPKVPVGWGTSAMNDYASTKDMNHVAPESEPV